MLEEVKVADAIPLPIGFGLNNGSPGPFGMTHRQISLDAVARKNETMFPSKSLKTTLESDRMDPSEFVLGQIMVRAVWNSWIIRHEALRKFSWISLTLEIRD